MSHSEPKLPNRLLLGAVAGAAGALLMTAAFNRMRHRRPPKHDRPRTPREIIDATGVRADEQSSDAATGNATTPGAIAYGAAAGSLLAAANSRIGPVTGALAGAGLWAASTIEWIPGSAALKAAIGHPRGRNALLLAVHLVWGSSTALALRELLLARATMLVADEDEEALGLTKRRRR